MEKTGNMKRFFAFLLIGAVFALGIAAVPQQADAACSWNGYLNSGGKCGNSYNKPWKTPSWSYGERSDNYFRLLERIEELKAIIYGYENGGYNTADVDVETISTINVDEDSAELRGELDLEGEDEAEVWFEYGERQNRLDERTSRTTINENDDEDFSKTINRLDENTLYYYRAVAEDENGDKDYGSVRTFRTDSGDEDEPRLETYSARDIEEDSAELRGYVDMNDFNNGRVFFVYGEDEDDIEDVDRDYDKYSDIDENGDDLQKVQVDSDLDGSRSYTEDVDGLDDETDIYYRICVEFEDEDDDDTLKCGDVESFETDED